VLGTSLGVSSGVVVVVLQYWHRPEKGRGSSSGGRGIGSCRSNLHNSCWCCVGDLKKAVVVVVVVMSLAVTVVVAVCTPLSTVTLSMVVVVVSVVVGVVPEKVRP